MAQRPEWLPGWVWNRVPARVRTLMADRAANPLSGTGDRLTMFDVGGPAARWAWMAFLAFWSVHLALPFIVYEVSSCPSHARKPLEAETPWWIRAPEVLSLFIAMYAEWRAFIFVVVPLLQWLRQLDLPLVKHPPFAAWLTVSTLQSFLGRMSAAATAVFVGSAWRRRACGASHDVQVEQVDELWTPATEQATEPWHVPITVIEAILIFNVAVPWLRVLHIVAVALPLGPARQGADPPAVRAARYRVDYGFQGMRDGYRVLYMGWDMWHADAIKVLAEGTNMAFLSKHLFAQQNVRTQDALRTDPRRGFQIMLQQMRREVHVSVLHGVLSMCVQLETQSVLFAWGRATFHTRRRPGSPGDGSLLWSIGLGVAVALMNIYGAIEKVSSTLEVARSLDWDGAVENVAKVEVARSFNGRDATAEEREAALVQARAEASAQLLKQRKSMVGHSHFFKVLIAASFAIVMHSLVRVVQAMRCEGGVSFWFAMCVELDPASSGTNVKQA